MITKEELINSHVTGDDVVPYRGLKPEKKYPPHHCVGCLHSEQGKIFYCDKFRAIPYYWQEIPGWEPCSILPPRFGSVSHVQILPDPRIIEWCANREQEINCVDKGV
jgi:hypothetical protein